MTKEQQEIARKKNYFLWHLTMDGRARDPKSGTLEIDGPIAPECVKQLQALIKRWTEEGLI